MTKIATGTPTFSKARRNFDLLGGFEGGMEDHMFDKTLRYTLFLPASLLLLAGCQAGTDPELEIAEGAAYLSVNEDDGSEMGAEGLIDDDDATIVDELADEETDGLPEPDAVEEPSPCSFDALRARVTEGYDTDGDGTLSREERRVLRQDIEDRVTRHPRLARLVRARHHIRFHLIRWAFDENNDRVLDETERQTLVDALESRCMARRAALLEAFDANGDGQLDPDERAAAREARRARLAAHRAEVLATYDADGDGTLSPIERQAWKAAVKARFILRKAELKAAFDADGNGRLSEEERLAAKAVVRENIATAQRPFEI